jgi:NAD(P)-dependent dehydrogenase (short-subunit alcohol dehydrogenase family)
LLILIQVHVVTGGSAGIGYGIVAHILQHNPAKIYLLSNKEQHADEAKESLKDFGDIDKVEWRQCNFEDCK